MGGVKFIIFSKNRGMQLRALLESLFYYVDKKFISSVDVIFKSDEPFVSSYGVLKEDFHNVRWIEEGNFRDQTIASLKSDSEFTAFLVDDIIFYSEVSKDFFPDPEDLCFSLRLGKNCKYCHPANSSYDLPREVLEVSDKISWQWANSSYDFGYPFSLDGHVFRTLDLAQIVESIDFKNPNSLENAMVYKNPFFSKYLHLKMKAFSHSKLVGIPVNRVNEEVPNRYGINYRISENELDEIFKSGMRINWEKMDFNNIIGPHQEIIYEFA